MDVGQQVFISSIHPDWGELASKLVSLLSITIMTILFGIKTYNVQFQYLTYSRWLVLALYIMSWGFTCAATLFVSTNNENYLSCLLSELACDIFYSGTKIIIYCWLIEKVWVVSSVRQSRWRTRSYRIHMAFMLPYTGIAALLIIFHIAEIEESGICIIGLKYAASIPLLIYDFVFNLYFTVLFIRPLMKIGKSVNTDWKSSRLHEVALRTMAASTVCLLVSFANILAIVLLEGRERGVLCLTCCTVDVTINVITIHWVTNNPTGKINKEYNTSSNNNDSMGGVGNGTVGTTDDAKYRRKPDMYNLGIDDEYLNDHPMYTLPGSNTLGYMGSGSQMPGMETIRQNHQPIITNHYGDIKSPLEMTSSPGNVPLGSSMQDQYRYMNGRFVMITDDKGDDSDDAVTTESRPCSIQESQSSRKSLTKV
ncbi:hypothetical protein K492DRAFT_176213 [Lichtheimia hyalospora FSU 10163]|nr:hypothetical protein K492DRAFT_176213 [Lichtheimia hyalospora FSU 10163]